MSDQPNALPSAIEPLNPDPQATEQISHCATIAELVRVLAESYGDRPALGWRNNSDPSSWHSMTYRDLAERADSMARLLHSTLGVAENDRVATVGFTSAEYTIASLAVGTLGAMEVPLQNAGSVDVWAAILTETDCVSAVVAADQLPSIARLAESGTYTGLRHVLVFDIGSRDGTTLDDAARRLVAAGTQVHLRQPGAEPTTPPAPLPQITANPDRVALLIYTSGSTGAPKGAMYTETAVTRLFQSGLSGLGRATDGHGWITLNFMPMSHVMGRSTLWQTLGNGGTAYFTPRADLAELLTDLAAVQPTDLQFVPRIWDMLYQEYVRLTDQDVSEQDALTRMREHYFGTRTATAITGSAPISDEVRRFVEAMLPVPLIEGYGSTEAAGVSIDGRIQRPPVVDYKLLDVPELGYLSTDRPHPRGELLVKTDHIFAGYYNRPDLTSSVFDDQGYYRTGDIVAETGPDQIEYVDRRNNVMKLSQGEFVAIAHIEAVLTTPPIQQLYVYGNSARPYLLAVVVPTPELRERHADDNELRREVLTALRSHGERNGLAAVEIPRDVIVERTPFSLENGLLTGIRKLARPQLKERYGARLEALYAELADSRITRLRDVKAVAAQRSTVTTVIDVVTAILDLADGEVTAAAHFTDLGGDSLTAVTVGNELRDIFDAEVPVGVLTSPSSTLADIAEHIDGRHSEARPTAESVHGTGTTLRAADLTLDKFLDEETLRAASDVTSAATDVRTVFITGATGFLGRYLTLDWLRRMAKVGGTVICLVRGADDDAARARLDAAFDSSDLWSEYQRLAKDHLRVLAGDKDSDHLALTPDVWDELAKSVDLIIDPAALVNHVLPYRELFGPNVSGTAELIRLAVTTTRKPYVYISTVGVGDQVAPGSFTEDPDIREMSSVREINDTYANGYGNSKWAGEVLLAQAHERFELPVSVFRCDMIVADDHTIGQLNLPDMFTRLLMSVLATGLAPRSFYQLATDGSAQEAHFDALPVDFLAEAINTLWVKDGARTFNAMNPHADGIGFDQYIRWLIDSGEQISLVDNYDDWYRRFGAALADLPEKQRRGSLIPLLHNYVHPMTPHNRGMASADRFHDAVRTAGVGQSSDIPHITPQIIENYARSLRGLGVI
ncbi:putative fatty-acid--CoA ligase [Gordonia effusa NBRC 100432]|uniref:Putative fatty-acid--CoA ligase n=1 Tax=Gordonia effusa NBRC 100432 TaxID=1077974 RepID=H0QVY8_9ACTN|nr:carboxylic acid reductase [Gordonia effusa]GAB16989.1 putative fatty-acid--CoA ligase [Gordonia effusa NBRC 100432]